MSDRTMTAAVETALAQSNMCAAILVELLLTAPVLCWSGMGTLTWNGKDFLGVGQFGGINTLEESDALKATGLQLSLAGISPDLVSVSLREEYQGKEANIWLAFFDENHQIIPDPVGPWKGRIDTMDTEIGDTCTIAIAVESRLIDWERPRTRRYTDADLQAAYPGDLGLEFIAGMVDKEILWGR